MKIELNYIILLVIYFLSHEKSKTILLKILLFLYSTESVKWTTSLYERTTFLNKLMDTWATLQVGNKQLRWSYAGELDAVARRPTLNGPQLVRHACAAASTLRQTSLHTTGRWISFMYYFNECPSSLYYYIAFACLTLNLLKIDWNHFKWLSNFILHL